MPTLISIDPGLRCCGVALFTDERLTACEAVTCDVGHGPTQRIAMAHEVVQWVRDHADAVDEVCIEFMVIRKVKGNRASRGDVHADLIQLSHVTGGIWAELAREFDCSVSEADPGVWTSGFSKEKNHPRIRKRLSPEETDALEDGLSYALATNKKEILDAVGIGLDNLGRL